MKPLRIHIVGMRGLPSTYSGYETFVSHLAPQLASRGHEVTAYCRSALFRERPTQWHGVRLRYLPSIEHKALSTLSHSLLAIGTAALSRPDVILALNAANGWFAWMPRLLATPIVVNVDGIEWLRPKWGRLARLMFAIGARLACRFSSAVVTDAVEMQRLYLERFGMETTCIAYGADIEQTRRPEMIEKFGLQPRSYFLVVGRLVPDNNADLVVEAFRSLKSDAQLVIVGGADYRWNERERRFHESLHRTADRRVKFLGHISCQDTLRELFCNSLAYIHGHEFGGTNPTLLTALGAGCMILALDTPFSNEVLGKGEYGLLFAKDSDDICSKMRYALANPETVAKMRTKAPERIRERYSWEHITDQYEALFVRLASNKSCLSA